MHKYETGNWYSRNPFGLPVTRCYYSYSKCLWIKTAAARWKADSVRAEPADAHTLSLNETASAYLDI